MGNLLLRIISAMSDSLLGSNIFHESTSLKYKNKGWEMPGIRIFATFLILTLLSSVSIFLIKSFIERNDISWNQNFYIKGITSDDKEILITPEDNLEVKLTLFQDFALRRNITRYFTLKAYQDIVDLDSNENWIEQVTISPSNCSTEISDEANSLKKIAESRNIEVEIYEWCYKLDNLSLAGDHGDIIGETVRFLVF